MAAAEPLEPPVSSARVAGASDRARCSRPGACHWPEVHVDRRLAMDAAFSIRLRARMAKASGSIGASTGDGRQGQPAVPRRALKSSATRDRTVRRSCRRADRHPRRVGAREVEELLRQPRHPLELVPRSCGPARAAAPRAPRRSAAGCGQGSPRSGCAARARHWPRSRARRPARSTAAHQPVDRLLDRQQFDLEAGRGQRAARSLESRSATCAASCATGRSRAATNQANAEEDERRQHRRGNEERDQRVQGRVAPLVRSGRRPRGMLPCAGVVARRRDDRRFRGSPCMARRRRPPDRRPGSGAGPFRRRRGPCSSCLPALGTAAPRGRGYARR